MSVSVSSQANGLEEDLADLAVQNTVCKSGRQLLPVPTVDSKTLIWLKWEFCLHCKYNVCCIYSV